MTFKIDGIRMKIAISDIDHDGKTGGIEKIQGVKSEFMHIKDTTEMGEALEHQNSDIENEERLSSVDFISRINEFQHAPISAVEFIASHGVISKHARLITRVIKRNAVSLGGKGREEFVDVVVGKKENDIRKSGIANMSGSSQK